MRIRIAQCLCPQRHAILAVAVDEPTVSDAVILEGFKAVVQTMIDDPSPTSLNPVCGLCGATAETWHYEIGWSKEFASREAALKMLHQMEAANLASRRAIDEARKGPSQN